MEQNRSCDCEICVYNRKIKGVIARRDTDELIALVNELADSWLNMTDGLNYYTSVFDGSWGNAVQVLEERLANAKSVKSKIKDMTKSELLK